MAVPCWYAAALLRGQKHDAVHLQKWAHAQGRGTQARCVLAEAYKPLVFFHVVATERFRACAAHVSARRHAPGGALIRKRQARNRAPNTRLAGSPSWLATAVRLASSLCT